MTTIELSGGSMGREKMLVKCNLTQAAAPVMVDYNPGTPDSQWQGSQYQCADCRHTNDGLAQIGMSLAAQALEVPSDEFECEWAVVED